LDLSKNTALKKLICYGSNLIKLDLSKNTALEELACSENKLISLNVSKNTALKNLNCSKNNLTKLDVSKNKALASLYCDNNKLTKLDISKNKALKGLSCHRNNISDYKLLQSLSKKFNSADIFPQNVPLGSGAPVDKIRTPINSVYMKAGASLVLPVSADSTSALGNATTKAKLTYKSSNKNIATVDAKGKVKAKKVGKATITIKAKSGKTAKVKVIVVAKAKKLNKIEVVKPPKTLNEGDIAQLKLKLTPASATNLRIKFKASGDSVTVDAAGKVTALKNGKAKITITASGRKTVVTIIVRFYDPAAE
jgi:hypothetical protein